MDVNARLENLMDTATSIPPISDPSQTIDRYVQLLQELFNLGMVYANEGDDEKGFVLLLKFVGTAVECLPNHDFYSNISISEQLSIDAKIIQAIFTAENLKTNLRKRYERELQDKMFKRSDNLPTDWNQLESILGPYIFCSEVSVQPIVFQQIIVPSELLEMFTKNTTGEFRFAYLYGRLSRNNIVAAQLVIANFEEVLANRFERFVDDTESDNGLPVMGCICTSLSDVYRAKFFENCHLSEIVVVICANGSDASCLLHLINMSPSTSFHQKTTAKRESNGLVNCRHLQYVENISAIFTNSSFTVAQLQQQLDEQPSAQQQQQQQLASSMAFNQIYSSPQNGIIAGSAADTLQSASSLSVANGGDLNGNNDGAATS